MSAGNGRSLLKLTVIIVSYNVRHYLDQCLRSVGQAVEGMEAEVIVVDNHSQDGSVDRLAPLYPWVTFVANNHNLGFARANNMAIRQSRGEFVLLLNPDTVVGENVLREAVRFMDSHERCGGVGVRMLHTDGTDAPESRRGIPTPMTSFYKMAGLCARYPANRVLGRYYMGWLPWDTAAQIEIMSGAFCMLRRRALDEVGLLDEDFFMYGEDIDLSYRLLRGGWENWYLPLKILHYKGESTQKTNFRYVHVFYEAMFIFLRKHYGHLSWFLSLPIRLGIYGKAAVALVSTLCGRVRHGLGFVRRQRAIGVRYLLDVANDHREQCLALMARHGLAAAVAAGDTDGGPADGGASDTVCYDVYDLDKYSFAEILDRLSASRDRGHRVGTFRADRGVVITESEIIQ